MDLSIERMPTVATNRRSTLGLKLVGALRAEHDDLHKYLKYVEDREDSFDESMREEVEKICMVQKINMYVLRSISAEQLLAIGVKLGPAVLVLSHLASSRSEEQECEEFLHAERLAQDSRTLVSTLIVGAAVGILASANATELPTSKNSTMQLYGDINYVVLVVSATLSLVCNVYGILALEFFGDWSIRIEASAPPMFSCLFACFMPRL